MCWTTCRAECMVRQAAGVPLQSGVWQGRRRGMGGGGGGGRTVHRLCTGRHTPWHSQLGIARRACDTCKLCGMCFVQLVNNQINQLHKACDEQLAVGTARFDRQQRSPCGQECQGGGGQWRCEQDLSTHTPWRSHLKQSRDLYATL
jgi:hypothetical protein